jgi:hypothetical protein
MIWFGNLNRILATSDPEAFGPLPEHRRMLQALQAVAERAPQLSGQPLIEALAATGWVDQRTAQRLLPTFVHFDPDRHFSEYLRSLSFRGRSAAQEFREGVRCIVEELTGDGIVADVGPEAAVRFRTGALEGVVLAHPEVSFTIGGTTRDALAAAVEEMPDVLVVVARNFDRGTADQLSGILARTGVPGTLVTVNLLLGLRAMKLRYRPAEDRVVELLGAGRPLRSCDIARLGER